MNMYTNTKKSKKFILIIVLIVLINFVCPKRVNASDLLQQIIIAPAKIAWFLVAGVLQVANNMFVEDTNKIDLFSDNGNSGTISLTPENIIKGKFLIFDANIFKDATSGYLDSGITSLSDSRNDLRDTIASWYYALRNLAIVALLSVLVYVGIRMIMTSIAQDKAKYKTMFKDWLIALCLLILMHYIMISILNICTMITEALGTSGSGGSIIATLVNDLSGILAQKSYTNNDVADAYAKLILLGVNIFFMIAFAVKYLKREFTIIFLILLGPISCVTYPIDKISDGKAQAFNKWFSEFMSEVLIQPFHLLLYIVLMGSAVQLADVNMIYTLVCLFVLWKSEDFVKDMFGIKDKLGSPLGAVATGALAANATNALMNKMKGAATGNKGGAGGAGGDDNSSLPSKLPPKTVKDKDVLGVGENDGGGNGNGNGPIAAGSPRTNMPQEDSSQPLGDNNNDSESQDTLPQGDENDAALNPGEDPGGGASAAAAYQNSDDPIRDMEKAALEERMIEEGLSEEDLSEEERALLHYGENMDGQEDETENSSEDGNTQSSSDGTENSPKKEPSTLDRLRATAAQRRAKSLGTTDRKQQIKRRAIRGLKMGAKGAWTVAKIGALGTVGAAAITGSLITGNGKQAMAIAGGLATFAGSKALKTGKKVGKYAGAALKDYKNSIRPDEGDGRGKFLLNSKESLALKEFKGDPAQIDKAVARYRKNHDGADPDAKALDAEMNDRFALSRYGLSDDEIDKAIKSYQELRADGVADEDALKQTVYASNLADDYSKKDFRSPKTMEEAAKTISQSFQAEGANAAIADVKAREFLNRAAQIKGVDKPFADTHQTIDIPIQQRVPNVASSLGIGNRRLDVSEVERMNRITVRLHSAGFSNSEIADIAGTCTGGSVTQVLNKYETKIKYLDNGAAIEEAKKTIESRNGGNNATQEQLNEEMKERLILTSTFDVKSEKDISALRDLEVGQIKGKTQIQAAREFARDNRGQLKNEAHMVGAREKLERSLRDGGSSADKAKKDAENIINLAGQYTGEI